MRCHTIAPIHFSTNKCDEICLPVLFPAAKCVYARMNNTKGKYQICHCPVSFGPLLEPEGRRLSSSVHQNSTTPIRPTVSIVHLPTGHQSTRWEITHTGAREMRSQDPPHLARPLFQEPEVSLCIASVSWFHPIQSFILSVYMFLMALGDLLLVLLILVLTCKDVLIL